MHLIIFIYNGLRDREVEAVGRRPAVFIRTGFGDSLYINLLTGALPVAALAFGMVYVLNDSYSNKLEV